MIFLKNVSENNIISFEAANLVDNLNFFSAKLPTCLTPVMEIFILKKLKINFKNEELKSV